MNDSISASHRKGEAESVVKTKIPHIFVILFLFTVVMAILTYLIPAGMYDRIPGPDGREMIDTASFNYVTSSPVGVLELFKSIPEGFVEAGWVIVLTFCLGGAFGVLRATGIIQSGVSFTARGLSKRGMILIPVMMTLFAVIDTFIGMPELTLVYVPILIPLALALGFDSVTATAIALCGSAAGFTAALTNPFTVGLGHKISGLPLYSGMGFRLVSLVVFLTIGILYVARYAKKVKENPKSSLTYEQDEIKRRDLDLNIGNAGAGLGLGQKTAGLVTLSLFLLLIFGVIKYKWDMPEIGGVFVAIAILAGLFSGLNGTRISESFIKGCQDVLLGALIIGVARGITVVADKGQIMDTIIYGMSILLNDIPSSVSVLGMAVFQSLFNFLIPSGSGQALITMPILAPLSDVLGVTRQTAMFALQVGDGFTNILYPTSGYFMAALAIAGVSWEKWVKFFFPLILMWFGSGCILLLIAQYIKLGPF